MSTRSAWRTRLSGAAIAALVLGIAGAGGASAHTTLTDADPAPDTTVTELTDVTLTFSDPVLEIGMAMTLVAQDGTEIELTPAVGGERAVTAAVGAVDGGVYELRWRVVAEDGHPIEGVYVFTYDAPAPQPSPRPSLTAPVEPPLIDEMGVPADVDQDCCGDEPAGGPAWVWALAGAAVLTVVWWVLVRRRLARDSQ